MQESASLSNINTLPVSQKASNLFKFGSSYKVPKWFLLREDGDDILPQPFPLTYPVIVRSCATCEDGDNVSFAGIFDSVVVHSPEGLSDALAKVRISKFSEHARSYIAAACGNLDPADIRMDCIVQEFKQGISGVAFSHDPDTGLNVCLIEASTTHAAVVNGESAEYFSRATLGGIEYCEGDMISPSFAESIRWRCDAASQLVGGPSDIEFVIEDSILWVVQVRRLHVCQPTAGQKNEKSLVQGIAIGNTNASGKVRLPKTRRDTFLEGEVLVVPDTSVLWEPLMRNASAVITDRGTRTSHCSIRCRELGIPAVVGTGDATRKFKDGDYVEVDCRSPDRVGRVYLESSYGNR